MNKNARGRMVALDHRSHGFSDQIRICQGTPKCGPDDIEESEIMGGQSFIQVRATG